jgi:hypothetical protein
MHGEKEHRQRHKGCGSDLERMGIVEGKERKLVVTFLLPYLR